MASGESIIEPRTDSSASRLWGGTRSGRSLRTSSATFAIIPPLNGQRRLAVWPGGEPEAEAAESWGYRVQRGRCQGERSLETAQTNPASNACSKYGPCHRHGLTCEDACRYCGTISMVTRA